MCYIWLNIKQQYILINENGHFSCLLHFPFFKHWMQFKKRAKQSHKVIMSFCYPFATKPIDSHRWINKTNYKLAACRHLRFAFQWIGLCCCCRLCLFYLYLIIINCIQTSLLWDANNETHTIRPFLLFLSFSFSLSRCWLCAYIKWFGWSVMQRIWILCVRFIDCVLYEKWRVSSHHVLSLSLSFFLVGAAAAADVALAVHD